MFIIQIIHLDTDQILIPHVNGVKVEHLAAQDTFPQELVETKLALNENIRLSYYKFGINTYRLPDTCVSLLNKLNLHTDTLYANPKAV